MINTKWIFLIYLIKKIEEILYNINMNARKIKKLFQQTLDISKL